jgi:hypothetical protein
MVVMFLFLVYMFCLECHIPSAGAPGVAGGEHGVLGGTPGWHEWRVPRPPLQLYQPRPIPRLLHQVRPARDRHGTILLPPRPGSSIRMFCSGIRGAWR